MNAAVWADGAFHAGDEPLFSALDPRPRLGLGLFESFVVQPTGIGGLDLHLRRLAWGAGRFGYGPVPRAPIASLFAELAGRAGLECARGRMWLLPPGPGPRLVLAVEALPADLDELRARGVGLRLCPWRMGAADPCASLKLASRAFHAQALAEAKRRGGDEALLVGEAGELRETTRSNLFLVGADGSLATPTLNDHFLAGVTRARLLAAARAERWPLRETTLGLADLEAAQEVFLTNAVYGVLPVREIEGRGLSCPGQASRWIGWWVERGLGGGPDSGTPLAHGQGAGVRGRGGLEAGIPETAALEESEEED